jgi:hypothetical protein
MWLDDVHECRPHAGLQGRSIPPARKMGSRGRRRTTDSVESTVRATWWPPASSDNHLDLFAKSGAGDGNRTHDIQLGKLSFYH